MIICWFGFERVEVKRPSDKLKISFRPPEIPNDWPKDRAMRTRVSALRKK